MDRITQSNAALAQQSAASSDELKAEAEQVQNAVAELMRMVDGQTADTGSLVGTVVRPTLPFAPGRSAAPARSVAAIRAGAKTVGGGQNGHGGGKGNGGSAIGGRLAGLDASDDHFIDQD